MSNENNNILASKETKDKRYSICKECEHFIASFKGCEECGCIIPAKIQFEASTCPVDKW